MRLRTILLLLLLTSCLVLKAQFQIIESDRIATLNVVAENRWTQLPIITLGSQETIHISFDDLTHEYNRYTYSIQHCDADWTPSEDLFVSDFLSGFTEGEIIEDQEESINTNVIYTHYHLQLPNNHCRLKMSGNYKVTVYDENNSMEPMCTACFMVVEPLMSLRMETTTNTDIDINHAHQQIEMTLDYGSLSVTAPQTQIKTVVMQNRRWNSAINNAAPQFYMAKGQKWQHCRELIFDGGNEYHKYEILDTSHPTFGIDYIHWDGEDYHVFPYADAPRNSYVYDEDANGAYYIRNSDNYENNRTSDYVYVHYTMLCPAPLEGRVYVNGDFTSDQLLPSYLMTYNEEQKAYTATILQKQGYYNYQYIWVTPSGSIKLAPTEGKFYETENAYQALVYYRGPNDRTDRLVASSEVHTR